MVEAKKGGKTVLSCFQIIKVPARTHEGRIAGRITRGTTCLLEAETAQIFSRQPLLWNKNPIASAST